MLVPAENDCSHGERGRGVPYRSYSIGPDARRSERTASAHAPVSRAEAPRRHRRRTERRRSAGRSRRARAAACWIGRYFVARRSTRCRERRSRPWPREGTCVSQHLAAEAKPPTTTATSAAARVSLRNRVRRAGAARDDASETGIASRRARAVRRSSRRRMGSSAATVDLEIESIRWVTPVADGRSADHARRPASSARSSAPSRWSIDSEPLERASLFGDVVTSGGIANERNGTVERRQMAR